MIKKKVCLRRLGVTTHISFQFLKVYGSVILSIPRQLADTSRVLLQLCVYQTNIYQYFSMHLCVPTCFGD